MRNGDNRTGQPYEFCGNLYAFVHSLYILGRQQSADALFTGEERHNDKPQKVQPVRHRTRRWLLRACRASEPCGGSGSHRLYRPAFRTVRCGRCERPQAIPVHRRRDQRARRRAGWQEATSHRLRQQDLAQGKPDSAQASNRRRHPVHRAGQLVGCRARAH